MRALEWNTNCCPNCRSFFEILDHWRRLYSKYSHLTQLINYLEYFLTQMTNIYIYILMQLYFPNRFNFPPTKTKWYDCREWDVWSLRGTDVTIHNLMFCLGNVKAYHVITCEYSDRTSWKFCYSKTSQKYLYESSKVWTDWERNRLNCLSCYSHLKTIRSWQLSDK